MPYPSISVVIPVKNEAKKIRACIEGILMQTIPVQEIIVMDSGSTDGTQNILQEYKEVVLKEILPSAFNHGTTRNLAVSLAKGEFVLMTVGDASAYNKNWIEELLKGFISVDVAGVCGQQVVQHDDDKNPIQWYKPLTEPEIKSYSFSSAEEFNLLSPENKKNICAWDNVSAMYRKSILSDFPFQEISYGEDALWAKEILLNKFSIVYNHKAIVYHYHNEDADFTFKRAFTTMYFRYKQFDFLYNRPKLSFLTKIKMINTLRISKSFQLLIIKKWYVYNVDNFNAFKKAYNLFMQNLSLGGDALDKAHENYCNKPPIPPKLN